MIEPSSRSLAPPANDTRIITEFKVATVLVIDSRMIPDFKAKPTSVPDNAPMIIRELASR